MRPGLNPRVIRWSLVLAGIWDLALPSVLASMDEPPAMGGAPSYLAGFAALACATVLWKKLS